MAEVVSQMNSATSPSSEMDNANSKLAFSNELVYDSVR